MSAEIDVPLLEDDKLGLAKNMPWVMLAVSLAAQTFVYVGQQAPATVAPMIQDDLGITRAQVGLFLSAFSFGCILTLIPAGWIVDRFGCRWPLFAGPFFSGLAVALSSRMSSYWIVIALVVIAGWGGGMTSPAATKAVMSWFTAKTRGTAMGIKQTGTSLGGALPAAVLPSLALVVGWRNAMGLTGLSIAAVGVLCLVVFRDHPGTVAPRKSAKSRQSIWPVLANRNMQLSCIAAVCFTGVQMSLASHLVLYFKEALLMGLAVAGALLAVAQMSGVVARVLLGLVSDRFLGSRRKVLLVVTGLSSTVCGIVVAFAAPLLPFWALVVLVFIYGFFAIGWTGIYLILVAEIVGKESTGIGSAVGLVACNSGTVLTPGFFGFLVDRSGSYTVAWSFMTLMAAVGTLAIMRVREHAPQRVPALSRTP